MFESTLLFLCLGLITVAAVAPAAEAGVSTSCAYPPLSLHPTPTPTPSCSLITAVRQPCLGGSHSIVLAPPSPIGAAVGAGATMPTPPRGSDWHRITVILGT